MLKSQSIRLALPHILRLLALSALALSAGCSQDWSETQVEDAAVQLTSVDSSRPSQISPSSTDGDAAVAVPTACGASVVNVGEKCGLCGALRCSSDGSAVCDDPGRNACGGCGVLSNAPNTSCGCDGKFKFACSPDLKSVTCGDPGANACGGCGTLQGVPGATCGDCGTYVCSADKAAVQCTGVATNVVCSGEAQKACKADGTWGAPTACSAGFCFDAQRCATMARVEYGPKVAKQLVSAAHVVLSSTGKVVVAGHYDGAFDSLSTPTERDGYIAVMPTSLATRSISTWKSPAPALDLTFAAAPLANDMVVVGGMTAGALYASAAPASPESFAAAWNVATSPPTFVWGRQGLGAGSPAVLAADAARGNVYVFGGPPSSITMTKMSASTGAVTWTRNWVPEASVSLVTAAVNSAGDVFVVGQDPLTSPIVDAVLVKFSGGPASAPLWTSRWGSLTTDYARGVVADAAGNIYVAGHTAGEMDGNKTAGNRDLFLSRFDSRGAKLWTKQWGTSGDDIIGTGGLTIGPAGELYMVGYTNGTFTKFATDGKSDIFVMRLDADGNVVWTAQSHTVDDDQATRITVDPSGVVYVSGECRVVSGDYTNTVLLKISPQ